MGAYADIHNVDVHITHGDIHTEHQTPGGPGGSPLLLRCTSVLAAKSLASGHALTSEREQLIVAATSLGGATSTVSASFLGKSNCSRSGPVPHCGGEHGMCSISVQRKKQKKEFHLTLQALASDKCQQKSATANQDRFRAAKRLKQQLSIYHSRSQQHIKLAAWKILALLHVPPPPPPASPPTKGTKWKMISVVEMKCEGLGDRRVSDGVPSCC